MLFSIQKIVKSNNNHIVKNQLIYGHTLKIKICILRDIGIIAIIFFRI